jgi:hypothetical protein
MEAHFLRHGSKGTVEMYLKLKPATNTGALVEIMRDTLLSVGKPWPFF